jgi:lysocardiolipin and lysophospholipid acyltransferase
MEQYMSTGRFPPLQNEGSALAFVETEVRTKYWWEFLQMYVVLGVFGLIWNMAERMFAPVLSWLKHSGSDLS